MVHDLGDGLEGRTDSVAFVSRVGESPQESIDRISQHLKSEGIRRTDKENTVSSRHTDCRLIVDLGHWGNLVEENSYDLNINIRAFASARTLLPRPGRDTKYRFDHNPHQSCK